MPTILYYDAASILPQLAIMSIESHSKVFSIDISIISIIQMLLISNINMFLI